MTEPYSCPKCNEFVIKSEIKMSKNGYMIPTNFFDGRVSKRGENHICPTDIRMPKEKQESKPIYVSEKSRDLGDYMKNMAKLGEDNYWHLFIDGKYRGPIEKAKPDDYRSWTP